MTDDFSLVAVDDERFAVAKSASAFMMTATRAPRPASATSVSGLHRTQAKIDTAAFRQPYVGPTWI